MVGGWKSVRVSFFILFVIHSFNNNLLTFHFIYFLDEKEIERERWRERLFSLQVFICRCGSCGLVDGGWDGLWMMVADGRWISGWLDGRWDRWWNGGG